MYVSIVLSRRATGTTIRTVGDMHVGPEGNQRAIEVLAGVIAEDYGTEWDLQLLQICEYEYHAMRRLLQECE